MSLYCNQGHENQTGSRFCHHCGEPIWLPVGHILEQRYRIVSQLGQGGFGRTYLAEYLHRFNDRACLKEFAPQVQGSLELQKAEELFEREAGALYKLDHPQLPRFREFFAAKLPGGVSCLFLAQDYVEGQTYCQLLKSLKRLSEADVTELICHLLPVLSYIHSQGVIHRDISPDNIILRRSDQLPVLIDFGGIKQVAATAVSKFTQLGKVPTRLGKKGYAPEEQLLNGEVRPSSDLYALAVTALVLLTGKEPQELYDNYKGTWLWRREIRVSSQLETVLQKMLAYKPGDRYQSADEVLQALQSPTLSEPPSANISQIRTINLLGRKPDPNPSPSQHKGGTQVISGQSGSHWLRPWAVRVAITGLVILTGMSAGALLVSVIRSIPSISLPDILSNPLLGSGSNTRNQKFHSRRQALGIQEGFFNTLVNETFYAKHPTLQGRDLTDKPEDARLVDEWYAIAEDLLDRLDQDNIRPPARRRLGSYSLRDYQTWEQKASLGQLSGYTIEQLNKQTDRKFERLFPELRGEEPNPKTFGQIWYAIAADKVSELETGN